MPEISDAELRQFVRYQTLGTPEEVQKKITDLERDNQKERDKVRGLSEKVPKDGEVVVQKTDAELLPKYKELGTVDEIKGKLTKGEEAQVKLTQTERRNAAVAFAKAAGLADEAVDTLIAIPELKDATFEVKKGKIKDKNGVEKDGEVGYLTLAGQPAMTFADAREKVPALKGLATATPQQRQDVQFVQQGSQGGQAGNVYERIRQSRVEQQKKAEEKPAVKPITERLGVKTQA